MATKIEWTDETWNPIRALNLQTGDVGWHCEHASEGCRFCYAEGINKRLGTKLEFKPGHLAQKHVKVYLDGNVLLKPFQWRNPREIFVCSMTDMLADFVEEDWVERMLAVMALNDHHFFQILTKRPENAAHYLNVGADAMRARMLEAAKAQAVAKCKVDPRLDPDRVDALWSRIMRKGSFWPLDNASLGASVEDQRNAILRVPVLLEMAARVRVVSAEPLLSPVSLSNILLVREGYKLDALNGLRYPVVGADGEGRAIFGEPQRTNRLDQIIVGGESDNHGRARPFAIEWAEQVMEDCSDAKVAFYLKQVGALATFAGYPYPTNHEKGGDPAEWPEFVRVRQHPDHYKVDRTETQGGFL